MVAVPAPDPEVVLVPAEAAASFPPEATAGGCPPDGAEALAVRFTAEGVADAAAPCRDPPLGALALPAALAAASTWVRRASLI